VKHRLSTLLPTVALMLIAALVLACGAWSYFAFGHVEWSRFTVKGDRGLDRELHINSSRGGLSIRYLSLDWTKPDPPGSFRFAPPRPGAWHWSSARAPSLPYPVLEKPLLDLAGFQAEWQWNQEKIASSVDLSLTQIGVVVPYWTLLLAAGSAAAWRVHRLRRRLAREHSGAVPCVSCGYDLRATPARCPECGTKTPQPSPAAP
jgi:predicted RNA-binding Zn-ribbon protein involved in translation (DUF1610 family)